MLSLHFVKKIISGMKPGACQGTTGNFTIHQVLLEGRLTAIKLTNIVKCSDILSLAITEIISTENILSIKSSGTRFLTKRI